MGVLYTSRIAYRGRDRLDTTVKSGEGLGKLLAPTWDLVGGAKHFATQGHDERWRKYAPLTPEQYIEDYFALLRKRYKADTEPFIKLLKREKLVICCYCAAGTFCHRHLAVEILMKIAATKRLPCECGGELPVG